MDDTKAPDEEKQTIDPEFSAPPEVLDHDPTDDTITEEDLINEDIDEELSEDDALVLAKHDGVEFVDYFTREIDGEVKEFKTLKEAKAAKSEDGKKTPIFQNRRQKQPNDEG